MADLSVETVRLQARAPLVAAWGVVDERELLRVRLDFGDGDFGEGEAAPLEPYDGVPMAAVRAAFDGYAAVLARANPRSTDGELLDACTRRRTTCPRRSPPWTSRCGIAPAGAPACRCSTLLAETALSCQSRSNATIGASDRAGAAEAAARLPRPGFDCVKVKVGVGDAPASRRGARRRGPRSRSAWTPTALVRRRGHRHAPWPRRAWSSSRSPSPGFAALREFRERVPCASPMDETAAETGARLGRGRRRLPEDRTPGRDRAARGARSARARAPSYLASTIDGPLGIAAALRAAADAAARDRLRTAGSPRWGRTWATRDVLAAHHGEIAVPAGPGLLG